jgi:hypothetical protein
VKSRAKQNVAQQPSGFLKANGETQGRWEDNIKVDFMKLDGFMETEWSWLRIETGGGHL